MSGRIAPNFHVQAETAFSMEFELHRRAAAAGHTVYPDGTIIINTVNGDTTMVMDAAALERHKATLRSMGMEHTEVYGPTDMNEVGVKERMADVVENCMNAPSVFNAQNDFDLGNQVRMLTRRDSAHEAVVCAARDRIWQLNARVAQLEAQLASTSMAPSLREQNLAMHIRRMWRKLPAHDRMRLDAQQLLVSLGLTGNPLRGDKK